MHVLKTTYRDSQGRLMGSETASSVGTATFCDAKGRLKGRGDR